MLVTINNQGKVFVNFQKKEKVIDFYTDKLIESTYLLNEKYLVLITNNEVELVNLNSLVNTVIEINKNRILKKIVYLNTKLYFIEYNMVEKRVFISELSEIDNEKRIIAIHDCTTDKSSLPDELKSNVEWIITHFNETIEKDKTTLDRLSNFSLLSSKGIDQSTYLYVKKNEIPIKSIYTGEFTIHKARFYSESYVYLNFSAPFIPKSLLLLHVDEIENELSKIRSLFSSSAKYEHLYHHESNIPYLKYCPIEPSNNIVVFLHGGPYFNFDFSYCALSSSLIHRNIKIFKLNTYGSTGYSSFYKEYINDKAGIVDYQQVLKFLRYLNDEYPNESIVLYGDSYGAYLCTLIAFSRQVKIEKIVCTSPFTDIRYQMLFSNSINLMEQLFSIQDIKKRNPQNLSVKYEQVHSLTIIHGLRDENCPYEQIKNFSRGLRLQKGKKFKLITLFNYRHYPETINMDGFIKNKVLEEILTD